MRKIFFCEAQPQPGPACPLPAGERGEICLRGVNVPALDGKRFEQGRLVRTCDDLPTTTRWWCVAWFGRTLNVLTDGEFRRSGCAQLAEEHAQVSCRAGAAHMDRPLRTFS